MQEESLILVQQLGDERAEAAALRQGDYTGAKTYCEQSPALFEQLGDQKEIAASAKGLALIQQGA